MSIQSDVNELNQIRTEIKRLLGEVKKLRTRSTELESKILDYLTEKSQPGVKYKGTAVIVENKEKRAPKKSIDREQDAIDVLRNHGINEADKVLKEILEARKGEPLERKSLKIKKIPDF